MDCHTQANGMIYPDEIILEITNICNLKCRFCHFHGENAQIRRKLGMMSPKIWETLLDEIEGWQRPCTLLTHGAGEPLLYPHLEALLTRAASIERLYLGFMTNGMLLTQEVSKMVVALQVKSVALSIDGVVPKTHDHFRVNADLRRIEANVETLIEEKRRAGSQYPLLTFNMVGYPEILDQEMDYVARWLPHAEQVMISKFRPVGSRQLWEADDAPAPFSPCPLLTHQAVISIDGEVGLCCEDINLDVPLGNVRNRSLCSIYNNTPRLAHYRDCHRSGEINGLPLCSDCHVWGGHHTLGRREQSVGEMAVVQTRYPSGTVYCKG